MVASCLLYHVSNEPRWRYSVLPVGTQRTFLCGRLDTGQLVRSAIGETKGGCYAVAMVTANQLQDAALGFYSPMCLTEKRTTTKQGKTFFIILDKRNTINNQTPFKIFCCFSNIV